jgi:hypothetical protein
MITGIVGIIGTATILKGKNESLLLQILLLEFLNHDTETEEMENAHCPLRKKIAATL